ncbi:MAG: ribosome-associated protein [Myxococcota bacterium]|jgi:ribosome-associated protein
MADDLPIHARLTIPGHTLGITAVRASGPGGQKVNKASTKVELRFDFEHTDVLSNYAKNRLRNLAAGQLDSEGRILLVSQATRSQLQNIGDARARLVALIKAALAPPPKARKPTKPSRASKRRRLDGKRRNKDKKALRGSIKRDD